MDMSFGRGVSCPSWLGSSETERLGDEEEDSESIDKERCLLRLFVVVSDAVSEGEVDGEGEVGIACVTLCEGGK